MSKAVDVLRDERLELQKKKQELSKKLRNAERKKKRLKSKAKELSNNDILDVIVMRANQKNPRKTKENCDQSHDSPS